MPLLEVDDADKARKLQEKFRQKERAAQYSPPKPGPITRAVSPAGAPTGPGTFSTAPAYGGNVSPRQVEAFNTLTQQESQQRARNSGLLSAGQFSLATAGNLGSITDSFTGAPIRGALQEPPGRGTIRGAVQGFLDPSTASGRDLPGIIRLPDKDILPGGLSLRDVGGGIAEAVADVGVVGGLAKAPLRAATRIPGAVGRNIDDAAIRAAAGPAERSTLGALRPAERATRVGDQAFRLTADQKKLLADTGFAPMPLSAANRPDGSWITPSGQEIDTGLMQHGPVAMKLGSTESGLVQQGWVRRAAPGSYSVGDLNPQTAALLDRVVAADARDLLADARVSGRPPRVLVDVGEYQSEFSAGGGARDSIPGLSRQVELSVYADQRAQQLSELMRGVSRLPSLGAVESAATVRARNVEQFGQPGRPRTGGGAVPPDDTSKIVPFRPRPKTPEQVLADLLVPDANVGTGILKRYEGAVSTAGLEVRRDMDAGNRILARLGVGKPAAQTRVVTRGPEVDELFRALHGEGVVPPRMQEVFDTLKAQVDVETAASVDFDPKFMAHPDYFPRGWRTVEVSPSRESNVQGGGGVGVTPGFAKPRTDASFTEILENVYTRSDGSTYRLEPTSWNPFEQMALRRVAGVEFREQKVLVDRLKQTGSAVVVDGPLPEGYRVPRVGPAFEGKPKIAPGVDGEPATFYGYTDRYAVPHQIADVLENTFGRKVSLGKGPDAILSTLQGAKRAKLMGSLFQQADFTARVGFAKFGGALDDLLAGKPLSAVRKVATFPKDVGDILRANVSPNRRSALRDEILSGKAIYSDRPGITLRGVSESGWNQADISIIRRDIGQAFSDSVKGESLPTKAKRNLLRLEAANQRGLFDGVYPQAQTTALKNWTLPRLMRQHPDWTDSQIMSQAADEINKAFSTLGDYQTIFKNPYVQHLAHNLIFSTNEPEALIRGFGSQFKGPNKLMWGEFYLGGTVFLAAVANLVHMATTGIRDGKPETLPLTRYNPLKIDEFSPLGVGYNTRFLTPDSPIVGEGGKRTMIDLVAQMDTALQLLDPVGFIQNRRNVGPRAIGNQLAGEDYYGNRIDTVGPKGIISRIGQAAADLYEPIGAGNIRGQVVAPRVDREAIGVGGGIAQASGLNVRAETAREAVGRGGFESLSGEQQLDTVRAEAWNEVKSVFEDIDAKTYGEWLGDRVELVARELRDSGFSDGAAQDAAEKAVAKEQPAKFYSDLRNRLEDQWGIDNPKKAAAIWDRESKLHPGDREFRPTDGVKKFIDSQR